MPRHLHALFFLLLLTCCSADKEISITTNYTPSTTFEWILNNPPSAEEVPDVDYIDIDGFEASAELIAGLKARGMSVIGYISVGSWENWRPDADGFPTEVIGKNYEGWAGEKWLDIRNIDLLGPILEARLDMLVAKGFDGIEPDNLDGYETKTGFDISQQDQLNFLLWLAEKAHARGLTIGQKNVPEYTDDLVDIYDWALTEDAFDQGWEADVSTYRDRGKPVFLVEYTDNNLNWDKVCQRARELDYTLLIKKRKLDTWSMDCDG